jgi:hypothetical protein
LIQFPDIIGVMRRWPLGILAVALTACAIHQPPKVDPNLYPTEYRKEIVNAMSSVLDDTSNIRDAGVTEPVLMKFDLAQRYASCVRFNPKKSRTEYAGVQVRIAIFYGAQLSQFPLATDEQCGHAVYKPFPELEKFCLRERC